METKVGLFYFALIATVILERVDGFHSGAPCSSQFTMSPSAIFHGTPQNTQTRPPPYRFDVFDLHDVPVRSYKEEVYKIRLLGQTPFRGFLIQARPSTKEGYPIGHLRVGEFLPDSTWTSQGLQIQNCPSTHNDSITHMHNDDKTAIEVMWKPAMNYGPILFVITIVQSRTVFWTQWLPPSGFLMPEETGFTSVNPEPQGVVSRQGPITVIKTHENGDLNSQLATTDGPNNPGTPEAEVTTEPKVTFTASIQHPLGVLATSGPSEVTETPKELSKITPDFTVKELSGTTPSSATTTRTLFELRTVAPTNPELITEVTTLQSSSVTENTHQRVTDSKQSLPPEILEGLNILNNRTETDFCSDFPCFNNGTCRNVPAEDRYECLCTSRWTGKQCETENFCERHQCKNGAECINGDEDYKCKCQKEWTGEFCERNCPSYLCDNGGSCILIDGGRGYGCVCAPGWTGEKCREEIDLCTSQPCQHGGTCTHKFNGFQCKCADGYMGSTCHRPCQDIYGSCAVWNEEERCETMRVSTKFFDTNCAATCKQCVYDNQTLLADVPLPPVLDPFDFLLGRWTLNTSTQHRFPLDFTANSTAGYHEEMIFSATTVPMFGTPSINYSTIAKNNLDPRDVHVNYGFLTSKPLTKPLKVSLMSTGNDGITVIEEGFLNGTELNLTTQYLAILPKVDNKAPALVKRIFALTNEFYLRETVERLGNNGQKDYFTKYYYKERKFPTV